MIKYNALGLALLLLLCALSACKAPVQETQGNLMAKVWLTMPDQSVLFASQDQPPSFQDNETETLVITVDPTVTYQSMEGFGYTLTGGSATLIHQLEATTRDSLLRELFAADGKSIGLSYIRLSIGASDLSDHVFSYDDLPEGQTDAALDHFSLDPERADLIPVLQEILKINPTLKILGSPWSAPVWMKDNRDTRGGSLLKAYYSTYAQYFVKYIQGMQAEGIRIDAVTIQNEPLHPGNNPSMYMEAADQAEFIRDHLGPAFLAAGLETKIILYDHNADRPDYPLSILADAAAAKFVDGSAFHLYGGDIKTLSDVHEAYPDKHLYFTEQWVGYPSNFAGDFGWHIGTLIIGAPRNWCRTVLEWNLAADANQDPHTDRGGCDRCLGALTIDGNKVTRNVAYYVIAHASKFVRPGAIRIASNEPGPLKNVAYKTPDNQLVLIVQNDGTEAIDFTISSTGKTMQTHLSGGAVGTYIWGG
ncbi:MAG: glycoside hydrolase family 30 beta sandwich domain-containing protein [Saprospiraceae bacterium]